MYVMVGLKTQKHPINNAHKKEPDKIDEDKAKGVQVAESDDDETFMEFIKYPPDYRDKQNKTRKYSYNDGIVYVFDTFGEMLDARYQKDL